MLTENNEKLKKIVSYLSRKISFDEFTKIVQLKGNINTWTGDQLKVTNDLILALTNKDLNKFDQNEINQLISNLSRKISFNEFMLKDDITKYELVFGSKGNWNNLCKQKFMKVVQMTLPKGTNSSFIVNSVERDYSPFQINNFTYSDLNIILDSYKQNM
jgi:hypothetical protein